MKLNKILPLIIIIFIYIACSSSNDSTSTKEVKVKVDDLMSNIGIGPISKVNLDPIIDQELAMEGKAVYDLKCMACHKPTEKFIGPAPAGIMDRRSPEWIMNMILNPEEMIAKDPVALKLLAEYNFAPMANQSITQDEARAILEYFRTL